MKRLMITTAVGLCLAAPAFAQSTTDQDQLNKQRANQPSTSAPSSQAAPSGSSSNMNQQGSSQSATQSQPSSSSSTSAQAPDSSGQPSATGKQGKGSKSGQAQNKRQPSDSSTSAQAPSSKAPPSGQAENRQMQQNDRPNARASRSDRSSAALNVNISDQQRTRIASVVSSGNVRAVNVNFRLNVGVAVPRTVVLHTLPSSIIEVVPEYRGYSYFVTREQIVIVEPRRKTIVAVLPAGGTARAQASDRVRFTDQQRDVIRKRASSLRSIETTGSSASYVVEQEIPATVELQEFPAEIVTEVPMVRTYRYFRQNNDVVVVDPGQRRVIEVIR